jgi:flagellar protein FlaJ
MVLFLLKLSRVVPSRVLSGLDGLKGNLAKASIRINFSAYVGLMVLASFVSAFAVFSVSLVVLLFFAVPVLSAVLFSFFLGLLAGLMSFGLCYVYPSFSISSRARKIDANLPLIANFMSVLAGSGMPPERVVRSLANVGDEFSVGEEARRTVADIELLGLDLNTALKNASVRSPSKKFAVMLDGLVTTSHMGGDLAGYLRSEADKYKKARMQAMKNFLESLGTLAEAYVSFMIALPLALVVMLSVFSFIGGGATISGMEPQVMLTALTFIVTPAGVGILLLMADSMTPPR